MATVYRQSTYLHSSLLSDFRNISHTSSLVHELYRALMATYLQYFVCVGHKVVR